jgi:steroid 5-alpha reductase family enzyme
MAWVALDSFAIVSAFMAVLWIVHLAIRNAAIVDAGWAAGLPMIAAFAAWQLRGGARAWLLAAMVAVWGLRLSAYLLRARVIGQRRTSAFVPWFPRRDVAP